MRPQTTSREADVTLSAPLHDDAVTLLRSLSGPHGIRASASPVANYTGVFARDGVMAGIAGLLTGDRAISAGLVRTLEHLRTLQGPQGQIPSNYMLREFQAPLVSFGTLAPRFDAPLWYLIGIGLGARAGVLDATAFRSSVQRVIHLLDALEYNGRHLLYVPVGGDWADEYIYEGYILHDQVLRAWALRLAGVTFGGGAWQDKAGAIERVIAEQFWPPSAARRGYPLAAYTPAREFEMFDLATSALAVVAGVGDTGFKALDWIAAQFLARGDLPPAFHPVIGEGDPDWPALSRYHVHGFRNRPHEYHNGGIWMIWLGWLALALAARPRELTQLRAAVDARLAAGAYAFEEFFHGETGVASGVTRMAYSATGVVFLGVADAPATIALLGR